MTEHTQHFWRMTWLERRIRTVQHGRPWEAWGALFAAVRFRGFRFRSTKWRRCKNR